jgi:spore maturation protein CgeB
VRALVVHPGPHFSVADVHRGWVKALKALGVTTVEFPFDTRLDFFTGAHIPNEAGDYIPAFGPAEGVHLANASLRGACFDFWPDLVLVVSGFFIKPGTLDVIRSRGMKVAVLLTESPYEDDKQLQIADHADLVVLNDPTNLDRFAEHCPTAYIPHAYDPDVHTPGPAVPSLAGDFGFCGTGYPSRIEFFDKVDWDGITARFAGHWQSCEPGSPLPGFLVHPPDECYPNDRTVDLYRSVKVSANLYRREAQRDELSEGWAMGPREVELAACDTFFLRHPRTEGDEVLHMLPQVTEPAEFGDLVRWWSTHDRQRQEVAAQARAAVADRTFTHSATRLLELINP